jgi:import inner membrane translocase subunit TIM8
MRRCNSSSKCVIVVHILARIVAFVSPSRVTDARPFASLCARSRSQEEKRKAVFNEVVAKLTEKCFDKCVTYAPGNKFSSSESSCLSNCALVYLQSGQVVLERLQNMGQR